MTTRHELPGGGWAELRKPDEVPERLRRPFETASMQLLARKEMVQALALADAKGGKEEILKLPEDELEQLAGTLGSSIGELHELNDLAVIALVSSWSYGPQVSLEALLDLPGKLYNRLREITAPLVGAMMPDFGPDQDAASPTAPSSD